MRSVILAFALGVFSLVTLELGVVSLTLGVLLVVLAQPVRVKSPIAAMVMSVFLFIMGHPFWLSLASASST